MQIRFLDDKLQALETSLFLPAYSSELVRLTEFVCARNLELYRQAQFTLISHPELDKHLIVAPTPDLGSTKQLGIFAGIRYEVGQRVALFAGVHLAERQDTLEVKRICKEYRGPGSYIWQIACGERDGKEESIAIDSRLKGSIARFINHSENPNTKIMYINGHAYYVAIRPVEVFEEVTADYGFGYFEGDVIPRNSQFLTNILKLPEMRQEPVVTQLANILLNKDLKTEADNLIHPNIEILKNLDEDLDNDNQSLSELIFDEKGNPLIFSVSSDKQPPAYLLNKALEKEITFTAKKRVFIAPLLFADGKRVFGLFAGEAIKAKQRICKIVGEKIEAGKDDAIDYSEGIHLGDDKFVSFTNKASEALFVQGGTTKTMNVQIIREHFQASRNIKAGELLLTYFGEDYGIKYDPFNLQNLFMRINYMQNYPIISYFECNQKINMNFINLCTHKSKLENKSQPESIIQHSLFANDATTHNEHPAKCRKLKKCSLEIIKNDGIKITLKKIRIA